MRQKEPVFCYFFGKKSRVLFNAIINTTMNAEETKGHLFKRLGQWVKTHRPHTIAIIGAILIAAAGITTYVILSQPMPKVETVKNTTKPKPVVKYYSSLDGTQVADQSAIKAPVTAIMIENSPDARPQSGLKQAQVVYEAIAEGGITRFLCLYQQNKPQMIGPVRSLRMYYLDWAAPYQPGIVHVGGSLYSLQQVRNGSYRNIDIEYHNGASWRASDRYAPHNVYTSFEKLDALNSSLGYTASEFSSFARKDGKAAATQDAKSIDVTVSSAAFNSHYDYDAATNTYARSQAGAAHTDREDGQISPSTIITLRVNMNLVMEDGWREDITTTGSGQAEVFQNGTMQQVTWSKASRTSPLQLLDANGKEVALVRGQTWITAVPNDSGDVTWQ